MIPSPIVRFFKKHHVLTLAIANKTDVWVAHCFYVWDQERQRFIFTSDDDTRHIRMTQNEHVVSAAIALETRLVGKIQGVQMSGSLEKPLGADYESAKLTYLKRFPYAILVKTSFWAFYPAYVKMTDNQLGFGKKLIWPEQSI